jgi:LysM repeat protein
MRNLKITLSSILIILLGVFAAVAQDLPPQITPVLDELSEQVGQQITVQNLDAVTWSAQTFSDASLGCPQEGEMYAQVLTEGYQFTLIYQGEAYDYRVSVDGTTVILCSVQPADTLPLQPTVQPCGLLYTVQPGDTLIQIANRCGTTAQAIVNANTNLATVNDVLFAGSVLTMPGQPALPVDPDDGLTRDLEPLVALMPLSGPPGSTVTFIANGFPPETEVVIAAGLPFSEYNELDRLTTDDDGALMGEITVPDFLADDEIVVVVEIPGPGGERAESHSFTVTVPDNDVTPTPIPDDQASFDSTNIYLIAVGDAGQSGELIGCDDSIVPVQIDIEPTIAPLTAALNAMFNLEDSGDLYNVFGQSDLSVQGINIVNRVATINLTGDLLIGGTCDTPRVEAQIRQTALQYDTIDEVQVTLNGQPLNSILSAQGG